MEFDDEAVNGEEMMEMVEDDDLEYLRSNVSAGALHYLKGIRSSGTKPDRRLKKLRHGDEGSDDAEDLEKEYEDAPKTNDSDKKNVRIMLPIKTSKGIVKRTMIEDESLKEKKRKLSKTKDEDFKTEKKDEAEDELTEILGKSKRMRLDPNKPVTEAELLAHRQEALNEKKFHIGLLCNGILENPEGKIRNFEPLLEMMEEKDPEVKLTVRKLAAISLLEVFKDVLPSYYIKIISDEGVKHKKETLERWKYEGGLLNAYKNYLTHLESLASCLNPKKGDYRKVSMQETQLGEVAVRCMSELLLAHPYFNYSVNIAQCLVAFLDNRLPSIRQMARNSLQEVLKEDKRGEMSLWIVRRINALVKKREHNIHCDVLLVLLGLRIRDVNLDEEKEQEIKQKKLKAQQKRLIAMSRKERKRKKHLKEVENELQEACAEENKQRKHKHLTEVTKVVFLIYFRVLKQEPNSKVLSAALEGLAKFSPCINFDYYHDMVNVLDRIMNTHELGYREQLCIVETVFTILSGLGESLAIDPCRFYKHLYRNILAVNAGKSHPDRLIMIRAIELILIQRRKKISHQRLLAFTKRLATLSLQTLHNGTLACLGHISNVFQLNKTADILLDADSTGGHGVYDPFLEDPEYCNAGSTALWELGLLRHHYHPVVRQFVRFISSGCPATGVGCLSLDLAKLKAEELFVQYDGSSMAFKPAVPPPKKTEPKSRPSKTHFKTLEGLNLNLLINDVNFFEACAPK